MPQFSYIFCFTLCLFGNIFLQDVRGMNILTTQLLQQATAELMSPLNDVINKLNVSLSEVEHKKQEHIDSHQEVLRRFSEAPPRCQKDEAILSHAAVLKSWDFDSCVTLTDDTLRASEIATEGGEYASNFTRAVHTLGANVLDCPTLNTLVTIKCYHTNLQEFKDFLVDFKEATVPIVTEGVKVAKQIRLDFASCVGIPVTSQTAIEEHLKNC